MKFQYKLTKLLKKIIVISMAMFMLISIVFYNFYTKYVDNRKLNVSSNSTLNIINEMVDGVKKFIDIENNKEKILKLFNKYDKNMIKSLSYDFYKETKLHTNIYILDNSDKLILEDKYFEIDDNILYFMEQIDISKYDIKISNYISQNKESIMIIKKNIIVSGSKVCGLVFAIPSNEIKNKFFNYDYKYIVADNYDKIYINNIGNTYGANKFSNSEIQNGYITKKVTTDNFNIISYVKKSFNIYDLLIFEVMFFIIVIFMYIIMDILTKKYVKKNTNSILKLLHEITLVREGKKKNIEVKSDDEIEDIAKAINDLIVSVEFLSGKNKDLEYQNILSELKRMQSQFNSHFLYNTLELIRTLIYVDVDKANQVIYNFSSLLRYSLDKINTIKMAEDIIYINKFMELQKVKYNRNFEYKLEIDEKIMDLAIPKLFLQPFIENSIKYGFFNKDKVSIFINATSNKDFYEFDIVDNGNAIDCDTINRINESLINDGISLENKNHYGITNSIKRLRLLFNNVDAGFVEELDKVHFRIRIYRS